MANKMKVAQVTRAGGPIEIVERPIPEPPADWVRVKVQACGVCHSDSLVKEGTGRACNIRAFPVMKWSEFDNNWPRA